MKTLTSWLITLTLIAIAVLGLWGAATAAPVGPAGCDAVSTPFITGSLAIDAPVIQQPSRLVDRSPRFHGCLQLHRLIGLVGLNLSGDYQLRTAKAFDNENKYTIGFECPLPGSNLTPYINYERRWSINDDRIYAGVRWGFSSH